MWVENGGGQKINKCIIADDVIKTFWRNQLIGILIDKFADQAYNSDDDNETKTERVFNFQRDYKSEVERLMERYLNSLTLIWLKLDMVFNHDDTIDWSMLPSHLLFLTNPALIFSHLETTTWVWENYWNWTKYY